MAKQLYDYWFVQFDFPNEEGKPYKSSGGAMVWNEKLKREIPKGWKDITLNAFIDKNKGGDWGYDTPKDGTIRVGCIRGADIIKLNSVPTRHITLKHSDRLLEDGDIVIEISGGRLLVMESMVVIGWTIFAQTDIHQLGEYLKTMFGIGHVAVADSDFLYFLGSNAVLLVALIAASIDYRVWMRRLKQGKDATVYDAIATSKGWTIAKPVLMVVFLLVSFAFLVGDSYNPFLYFRF